MTLDVARRLMGYRVEVASAFQPDDVGIMRPLPQARWFLDRVVAVVELLPGEVTLVLFDHGPLRLADGDLHVRSAS
jgi:hypothetical protein